MWACSACGRELVAAARPLFCGTCGRRNSFAEVALQTVTEGARDGVAASPAPSGPVVTWASDVRVIEPPKCVTRWKPWTRVTGEMHLGLLHLLGGQRGTGKTRLAMQLAPRIVRAMQRPALFCPLEQKTPLARVFMRNVGVDTDRIAMHDDPDLESITAMWQSVRPAYAVIDALKLVRVNGRQARADTPAEHQTVLRLLELASAHRTAVLALLHNQASQRDYSVGADALQLCDLIVKLERVTRGLEDGPLKEGEFPRVRLLVDEKNRWGPTHLTAEFFATDRGLVPVEGDELPSSALN